MMWLKLLGGIMTTTKAKVGISLTSLAAAAGLIFSFVNSQVDDVRASINNREASMLRYVDSKHGEVKEDLNEIKEGIKTLDKRLYDFLKSQSKQPRGE